MPSSLAEVVFTGLTAPEFGITQYSASHFTTEVGSVPGDIEKLFAAVAGAIKRARDAVQGPFRVKGYELPGPWIHTARVYFKGVPIRLMRKYDPVLQGYRTTADFCCEGLPDGFFDSEPETVS